MSTTVEVSIQHRCPNMGAHMRSGKGCACHPRLPVPCPECFSARVTAERIPYQPSVPWHSVSA